MISNTAQTTTPNDEIIHQDRLAHAKKFAVELSESRLREMTRSYRRRWTPAKRAEKAKIIQTVKPWRHATGPKSGPHAKGAGFEKRAFASATRQQNWFLRASRPFSGQRKSAKALGLTATAALYLLLAAEGAEIWAFPHVTKRNNE